MDELYDRTARLEENERTKQSPTASSSSSEGEVLEGECGMWTMDEELIVARPSAQEPKKTSRSLLPVVFVVLAFIAAVASMTNSVKGSRFPWQRLSSKEIVDKVIL